MNSWLNYFLSWTFREGGSYNCFQLLGGIFLCHAEQACWKVLLIIRDEFKPGILQKQSVCSITMTLLYWGSKLIVMGSVVYRVSAFLLPGWLAHDVSAVPLLQAAVLVTLLAVFRENHVDEPPQLGLNIKCHVRRSPASSLIDCCLG